MQNNPTAKKQVTKQMERDGIKPDEKLTKEYNLSLGLSIYIDAWLDLDTERKELAPIPWSCIVNYANHYGMNVEETLYFIRKMDDAYIDDFVKRHKKDGANAKASGAKVTKVTRPDRPSG